MSILGFLGDIFKPAVDLIDNLHTSDEEKGKIKIELTKMQNEMASKMLDYQSKLMESRATIIKAEANGQSWMQRNWRPVTMFTFLVLVVLDSFAWLANPLAPQAWTLLQIGLGGYVVGRSIEKTAPRITEALKK